MHDAHTFLLNLAMVFGVAAAVTVVFHRLKLPVVLGYLLAGMVVGPHVPIVPIVADAGVVNALAELGVILLMFGIGLEFSLRKLAAVAPTGGLIALGEVSFVAFLGFQAGQMLGWTTAESLFTGAIVAISSTSIIAKAFEERNVTGPWRDVVFGILIVEDLLAILLLVALGLVARGAAVDPAEIGGEIGRLTAALTATMAVGLLVVPRLFRYIVATGRQETIVVSAVGLCFALALLMQQLGYSVALGAFAAGMMVAESGHGHDVFEAVRPLRDAFTALFFVAVGMLIDPVLVWANAPAVMLLVLVVISGKLFGVSLGSFLLGNGLRTSVQAGMSMTQIGEFSFVIATLGTASGVVGEFVYPVAVAVSVVTTFTTPYAIRGADPLARKLHHKLPKRLQTWTSLYTAWVEQVRTQASGGGGARRVLIGLVGDVALMVALAAAYGVYGDRTIELLVGATGVDEGLGRLVVGGSVALLAAPLAFGIVRLAGLLADSLVEPLSARLSGVAPGAVRALSAGVRVAVTSLAGLIALALSMPWLPAWPVVIAFVGIEAFLVLVLWRSAATMEDEFTPGAAVIARAILQGTASGRGEGASAPRSGGLLTLTAADHGVGRTLIELDLRARTGASVVAVQRPGKEPEPPSGREPLIAGITLTLVGAEAAVAAAERLLREGAGHEAPGELAASG